MGINRETKPNQLPGYPEIPEYDDNELHVDLTDPESQGRTLQEYSSTLESPIHRVKATGANRVAMLAFGIFGITLFMILLGGFYMISSSPSPEAAKAIITEAVVPFLQGAMTFVSGVFAAILAFILGFYFGRGQR